MTLGQSIDGALTAAVGDAGLSADALAGWVGRTADAMAAIRAMHGDGRLPLLDLPGRTDDLDEIHEAAAWLSEDATDVVVLGTGGSSLGGQTLAQVTGWRVAGILPDTGRPHLHFLDNLDPWSLDRALAGLPLGTTRWFVVSKSGGTGETLLQTMAVLRALGASGLDVAAHVLALTEPDPSGSNNKLRALLAPHGVRLLEHDPGVGGRYTCLTNVGLVPAAVAGLDPRGVRAGAASALAPVLSDSGPDDCPAAIGAALAAGFAVEKSIRQNVFLAYSDRLERFTRWWAQLWAESLGKDGHGMTPVAAIGPVDQHSQLQLFLDGPNDKLHTVILTGHAGAGPVVDGALAERAREPGFAGRAIGDFVAAQQRATVDTLIARGRPVRTLEIHTVDAEAIGALMMGMMLETMIAARLLGVNAFDQPAVEEGKVLAKRYLAEMSG